MPPSERDIEIYEKDLAVSRLNAGLRNDRPVGTAFVGGIPASYAGLAGSQERAAAPEVARGRFMDRMKRRFTWMAIVGGVLMGLLLTNAWRLTAK